MHSNHIMIDIETMSTESDAAIISICALEFGVTLGDIGQSLTTRLDPKFTPGRRSPDTLKWWMEQDPGVRRQEWSGTATAEEAADLLDFFVKSRPHHWVWASPSTFDLSILKTFYRSHLRREYPINWRRERDLSTLNYIAKELGIDLEPAKNFRDRQAHDPWSDCVEQAREVQLIFKTLGGWEANRPAYQP
jgi:hypothetical protein